MAVAPRRPLTVHLPHPGRYCVTARAAPGNGDLLLATVPTELRIGDAGGEFDLLVRRDGR